MPRPMDDEARRRRALSGDLGPDAQRLELDRIAAEIAPSRSLFTPRQTWVVLVVSVLLIATIVALAAVKHILPRPA
jgi:hypothetical protein